MLRNLSRSVLVVLASVAATATGQSLIEAENLLFAPPTDFHIKFDEHHDARSITEWIPAGQSVDDWTEMLTVQIFRHATVDGASFLQGVDARYTKDCPGTTAKGIFTGHVNDYVVSMLLLQCPLNPATRKPETTAFRAIKGNDALYLVQHAWRAIPSGPALDAAMQSLVKVTVCDTRTPDHPCPALDALTPGR